MRVESSKSGHSGTRPRDTPVHTTSDTPVSGNRDTPRDTSGPVASRRYRKLWISWHLSSLSGMSENLRGAIRDTVVAEIVTELVRFEPEISIYSGN